MDFRMNLATVYVGNLHPKVDYVTLWSTFRVHGRVRDIHLSRRRVEARASYAFVRFETLHEAERIAETMNGIHFYGWPITTNVAKRGWKDRKMGVDRQRRTEHEIGGNDNYQERQVIQQVSNEQNMGGASYANVVRIGNPVDKEETYDGVLKLHPDEVELGWLARSMVGITESFRECSEMEKEFYEGGWVIKVAFMTHRSYLCSFENMEDLNRWKMSQEAWSHCFISVFSWESVKECKGSVAWITCKGLPLPIWNMETYRKLGDSIGMFIKVDEETLFKRRLDRVRLLVLRHSIAVGPWKRKVRVEGRIFQVWLTTERGTAEETADGFKRRRVVEDEKQTRSAQVQVTGEKQRQLGKVTRDSLNLRDDSQRALSFLRKAFEFLAKRKEAEQENRKEQSMLQTDITKEAKFQGMSGKLLDGAKGGEDGLLGLGDGVACCAGDINSGPGLEDGGDKHAKGCCTEDAGPGMTIGVDGEGRGWAWRGSWVQKEMERGGDHHHCEREEPDKGRRGEHRMSLSVGDGEATGEQNSSNMVSGEENVNSVSHVSETGRKAGTQMIEILKRGRPSIPLVVDLGRVQVVEWDQREKLLSTRGKTIRDTGADQMEREGREAVQDLNSSNDDEMAEVAKIIQVGEVLGVDFGNIEGELAEEIPQMA